MAVNLDNIAERVMKFIRGNGLGVKMYDNDTGKSVADPSKARYFYIEQPNMVVFLDDNEGTLNLHVGEGLSINDSIVDKLRNNLRDMARDNTLDFDIRTFGEKIQPKNYAYKIEQKKNQEDAVEDVYESVSPMEGSTRTSRQHFENATLIVRHKNPVNEEVRGARSRNIQSIFIENSEGERFKYPYKHLAGARAMARHVSSGGVPSDMTGESIIEMSTNLSKLKEFMRIVDKQQLVNETNRDVVLNVKRKMKKIKENLNKIQTSKGYTAFVESLALNEESTGSEVSEDVMNSYVNKFTKSTFEEALKDIIPLVHRVNEEEYEASRDTMVEKVMGIITAKDESGNRVNDIKFSERKSTVEAIKGQGEREMSLSEKLADLAKRVDVVTTEDRGPRSTRGTDRGAVLSMFLNSVAEAVDADPLSLSEEQQKLANYFLKKSEVKPVEEHVEETASLDEKIDKMVMEAFDSNFKIL